MNNFNLFFLIVNFKKLSFYYISFWKLFSSKRKVVTNNNVNLRIIDCKIICQRFALMDFSQCLIWFSQNFTHPPQWGCVISGFSPTLFQRGFAVLLWSPVTIFLKPLPFKFCSVYTLPIPFTFLPKSKDLAISCIFFLH